MLELKAYSGLIRNHEELAAQLGVATEGLPRREREERLLVAAYERWGTQMGAHLNGQFALALLDDATDTLFCTRDPLGAELMFYYPTRDGRLLVGTQIADLFDQPGFERRLNRAMIQFFLAYNYVPGEETLFAGVRKLEPGGYLTFHTRRPGQSPQSQFQSQSRPQPQLESEGASENANVPALDPSASAPAPAPANPPSTGNGPAPDTGVPPIPGLELGRFWELAFNPDESKSLDEWADEIEAAMDASLRDILDEGERCDSFLSGGVDSSYILAKSPARTGYCVAYTNQQASEEADARATAERLGRDFQAIEVTPEDFFANVDDFLRAYEQPSADPAGLALFCAARQISSKLNGAASGPAASPDSPAGASGSAVSPDGATGASDASPASGATDDGAASGPGPTTGASGSAAAGASGPGFDGPATGASGSAASPDDSAATNPATSGNRICFSGEGADEFFAGYSVYGNAARIGAGPDPVYCGSTYIMNATEQRRFLKDYCAERDTREFARERGAGGRGYDTLTWMLYTELRTYFEGSIMFNSTRIARSTGLDIRMPYCDLRMFDVALRMPARFKYSRDGNKIALRAAASRVLPDEVAYRRKLGFPVPVRTWLADPALNADIERAFESETAAEFFNVREIGALLDAYLGRRPRVPHPIWFGRRKAGLWRYVWTIYLFIRWYELFFAR